MEPIAEVIESSLVAWKAQAWQWDIFPSFGCVMEISQPDMTLLGIVSHIETGPTESNRAVYPYKKTESELLRDQPQIFSFLKTHFTCTAIGFIEHNTINYQLPARPAKIHAFVSQASLEALNIVCTQHHYLSILFKTVEPTVMIDELLLAFIKELAKHTHIHESFLDEFIENFYLHIGNDYRRLKLFIQRLDHITAL